MTFKARLMAFFQNNLVLKIVSVIVAIILWFAVAVTLQEEQDYIITGVPIKLDVETSALSQSKLQPIVGQDTLVSVVVRGKRSVVGSLTKDDVIVTGVLTFVNAAGTHTINLTYQKTDVNAAFTIVRVDPGTVMITFDKIIDKTVPVKADISVSSVPDGYIMNDAILENKEVTLSGPQSILANVDHCGVTLKKEGTYTKTINETLGISCYTADGQKLDDTDITYSTKTTKVTIPILKLKTLNLTYEIINAPVTMPTELFSIQLSKTTLKVAAPEDIIDSIDALHVGYIDVKDLKPGAELKFKLNMPNGFINMDDTEEVTAVFEGTGVTTRTFRVTNIKLVNTPADYTVRISTSSVSGVLLACFDDQLKDVKATEIIAEADLSQIEMTTGQTSIPVTLTVPDKDKIWALGSYTIVISVQKNS